MTSIPVLGQAHETCGGVKLVKWDQNPPGQQRVVNIHFHIYIVLIIWSNLSYLSISAFSDRTSFSILWPTAIWRLLCFKFIFIQCINLMYVQGKGIRSRTTETTEENTLINIELERLSVEKELGDIEKQRHQVEQKRLDTDRKRLQCEQQKHQLYMTKLNLTYHKWVFIYRINPELTHRIVHFRPYQVKHSKTLLCDSFNLYK